LPNPNGGISYLANHYNVSGSAGPVFQSIGSTTPLTNTITIGRIGDGPTNTVFFAEGFAVCQSKHYSFPPSQEGENFHQYWITRSKWQHSGKTMTSYAGQPFSYYKLPGAYYYFLGGSEFTQITREPMKAPTYGPFVDKSVLSNNGTVLSTPNYYPLGNLATFSSILNKASSNNTYKWTDIYHPSSEKLPPQVAQGHMPQTKAAALTNCDVFAPQAIWNGVFQVVMGDGSVRNVNQNISAQSWLAVLTPNGQDTPGKDW
jgi:hypothetical protein